MASLAAAQHKLQQDEALYARAERDRVRYKALVEKHEISRSDYDARETEAAATSQAVEADRATVTEKEQNISQTRSLGRPTGGTDRGRPHRPATGCRTRVTGRNRPADMWSKLVPTCTPPS